MSLLTPPNIGHSDIESIGRTYVSLLHDPFMRQKDQRTVWERVKEALREAGLPPTQVHAAKLIGGEQGSISDWNKPNRGPTIENTRIIALATNTCVEWLLTGEGPKHPGPPMEPAATALWSLWARLPEITKGEILGIAKSNVLKFPPKDNPGELYRFPDRPPP